MKYVLVLTCLVFVCHCGTEEDFKKIDSIVPEEPCSSQGGMCTIAADCPEGLMVPTKGLCPEQQKLGIECCYGFSVKETRCERHGGSCIGQDVFCNKRLVYQEATDCAPGHKCCILV